jgi:VanZ family protein
VRPAINSPQLTPILMYSKSMYLDRSHPKLISALCIFVVGCVFAAGLWPFHIPRNAVSWAEGGNGLRFGRHGAVMSAGEFRTVANSNDNGASIEIWLVPASSTAGGAILTFDSSPDPRSPFLLRQYGAALGIHRYLADETGKITQPWFKVAHVFSAGKPVFVTLTSSKNQIECYVNGVLAGTFVGPGILNRELTGRLVLANSTVDDSWRGEIAGLAIYNRELTPPQVRNHFQTWDPDHGPALSGEQSATALYLFNERAGNVVHNVVDSATNLTIPAEYFVLHPGFLRVVWSVGPEASRAWHRWSTWEGLLINISGFMPVGFVFFAYFSARRTGHPVLVAMLLGLFLSLTIEVLQRLLPNRDSGLNDVFTNTAGTALGVLLHRSSIVQTLWIKVLNVGDFASKGRPESTAGKSRTRGDEKLTLSV